MFLFFFFPFHPTLSVVDPVRSLVAILAPPPPRFSFPPTFSGSIRTGYFPDDDSVQLLSLFALDFSPFFFLGGFPSD